MSAVRRTGIFMQYAVRRINNCRKRGQIYFIADGLGEKGTDLFSGRRTGRVNKSVPFLLQTNSASHELSRLAVELSALVGRFRI